MGTTRYYSRYIKVLLTPYKGAITIGGIDLSLMCFKFCKPIYSQS